MVLGVVALLPRLLVGHVVERGVPSGQIGGQTVQTLLVLMELAAARADAVPGFERHACFPYLSSGFPDLRIRLRLGAGAGTEATATPAICSLTAGRVRP